MAERKAMRDGDHALSISRQAQLAGLSRGSVYYVPKSVSAADLVLMRQPGRVTLEAPFMGMRMLRDQLNREGFMIGRTHVPSIMARMGMEALYRKPGISKKHPGHEIYPYRCAGSPSTRPTRCGHWIQRIFRWPKGLSILTAVVDWASRKVLAEKIAITLETCHVVDVLQEAFTRHGKPEIVNAIQGLVQPIQTAFELGQANT
jgi:putative transposase